MKKLKCVQCGGSRNVFIDVHVRQGRVMAKDGMKEWELVGNHKSDAELGPWCDDCVEEAVRSGGAVVAG